MGSEDYELTDKLESIADSLKSLAESQKRMADIAEWLAKQRGMMEKWESLKLIFKNRKKINLPLEQNPWKYNWEEFSRDTGKKLKKRFVAQYNSSKAKIIKTLIKN